MNFSDATIESTYASGNGGFLYLDDSSVTLVLSDFTIDNSTSGGYGGAFYVANANSITISSSTLSNFSSSKSGSLMYSESSNSTITIESNIIECSNTAYGFDYSSSDLQQIFFKTSVGGAFYI